MVTNPIHGFVLQDQFEHMLIRERMFKIALEMGLNKLSRRDFEEAFDIAIHHLIDIRDDYEIQRAFEKGLFCVNWKKEHENIGGRGRKKQWRKQKK